ncbi:MAG: hypothetical protein CM15mP103_04170 [Gammaproteobacteria bacterium]|nr:MAG: hypothetical protein CM15mP103_04170 [Gammaproteobacteria bacterium]
MKLVRHASYFWLYVLRLCNDSDGLMPLFLKPSATRSRKAPKQVSAQSLIVFINIKILN